MLTLFGLGFNHWPSGFLSGVIGANSPPCYPSECSNMHSLQYDALSYNESLLETMIDFQFLQIILLMSFPKAISVEWSLSQSNLSPIFLLSMIFLVVDHQTLVIFSPLTLASIYKPVLLIAMMSLTINSAPIDSLCLISLILDHWIHLMNLISFECLAMLSLFLLTLLYISTLIFFLSLILQLVGPIFCCFWVFASILFHCDEYG